MDKEKIENFVLDLIEEIDSLGETVIGEFSGSIRKDLEKHKEQIQKYKETLQELLK